MPGNSGKHAITAAWRAVQGLTKSGGPLPKPYPLWITI